VAGDRFRAIAGFTDDALTSRADTSRDSAEGLWKKIGVVEGASDVSWHKDCSLGGHSRRCCGLTVGIAVTGADAESGELGVVAGSHRANVQGVGVRADLDLPRVPLPTRTGDVTVHCSCTLHMSRPPVSRERRVVYTGFDLAPREGDVARTTDVEDVRRDRASLNDRTRRLQRRTDFGVEHDSYTLERT
jgi:ectoine hydroxylase-related dioxygenase (phytanoyl-CoA dioxygenase family)